MCAEIPSNESDESDIESDGEGYDSDVQKEMDIDYKTKIYEPLRQTSGVKPQHQETEPSARYVTHISVCMSGQFSDSYDILRRAVV